MNPRVLRRKRRSCNSREAEGYLCFFADPVAALKGVGLLEDVYGAGDDQGHGGQGNG